MRYLAHRRSHGYSVHVLFHVGNVLNRELPRYLRYTGVVADKEDLRLRGKCKPTLNSVALNQDRTGFDEGSQRAKERHQGHGLHTVAILHVLNRSGKLLKVLSPMNRLASGGVRHRRAYSKESGALQPGRGVACDKIERAANAKRSQPVES